MVRPRPRPEPGAGPDPWQAALVETPGQAEQRLRRRVGQMVAAQVVEDAAAGLVGRPWGYHAYNAVLKRVLGKARAAMSLAELEAAVGWLERNRVLDHAARAAGRPALRVDRPPARRSRTAGTARAEGAGASLPAARLRR